MARNRISSASMAGDKRSSLGLFGSLALHGLVVAGMFITFSHKLDIVDQSTPVVPVDLVTLGTKTNVMAMVKAVPKVESVKPTPVPPDQLRLQTPSVPQQAEDTPPPEPAPSEAVAKAPPPRAIPKERPKETPKEKNKFDLDAVSALLNKVAPQASRSNARVGNRTIRGIGDQTAMTADLVAMIASKMAECYSPPAGAPNPADLIADFDVALSPDGNLARPPRLLSDESNSYQRAGAEAARRAIYECAPYNLPQDRYSEWREINPFHFDPRTMMGE